jgi:hypothetical protein
MSKVPRYIGEKVEGPPEGWRPRALTVREKLEIVVRQAGCERNLGARLLPLTDGVEFHHDPALQRRRWDPDAQDTVPASCDLSYIVAMNKPAHREQTAKRDVPEIAKTKRLEGKSKPKVKRAWAKRPMQRRPK